MRADGLLGFDHLAIQCSIHHQSVPFPLPVIVNPFRPASVLISKTYKRVGPKPEADRTQTLQLGLKSGSCKGGQRTAAMSQSLINKC